MVNYSYLCIARESISSSIESNNLIRLSLYLVAKEDVLTLYRYRLILMAQEPLDFFASNTFQSYTTSFPFRTRRKSSVVPGATRHSAIYSTSTTVLHDTLISFLSYINTYDVPILPVTKPDIRTVLGEGASFLVNGCEIPRDYVDPSTGRLFPKGTIVALKRAKLINDMEDLTADRIRVIFNELLTMNHPPLAAHPNIVNLLGVGFETEGPSDTQNAMPVLIPECAELGNLAENLEAARREDRPLAFHEKMSLCLDVLHGMEILHACDIVHGDVKAENILVFEKDDSKGPPDEEFRLNCKLTDFGVSRLPSGELVLGGSRPWQAPECHRGAYLRIEDAKRTDIYSFGMLLWRVCLDGDPFKSLGEFEGETAAERRTKRNQAITRKKDSDSLVQHVCNSLALSDQFSRAQLDMLCEVISITLLKDPSRRELDVRRIIRLLTPDNWFQPRHVLPPARLPIDVHTNLLDLEKWHSEFEGISPVVQSFIVQGYRDYALSPQHELQSDHEEKRSAAAYQLAVCCANGFGGKFHPSECIKWLTFAAERGSQHAQDSLPIFLEAFPRASTPFRDPWASDKSNSTLSSSWGSDFISSGLKPLNKEDLSSLTASSVTFLSAAEDCNYFLMEKMLDEGVNLTVSPDGVSPLHFLSSWDLTKAEQIGRRLIKAGADINAIAERGSTVGGTPLMWSVYGNHVDHSLKLLKLGADTMVAARNGEDALAFAAKLHLADHLRLLLENTRPAHVRGHLHRLIEAAAGGESCFTRINRHGKDWQSAATDTLELLQGWNVLFTEATFQELVISAVHRGILSPYGRMNTDVQMDFLDYAKVGPSGLNEMLRESILSYNEDLLVALLDRGAPVNSKWDGETLLHLCAKIPDHSLAATAFAPRLLTQGAVLDSPDDNGITPCKSCLFIHHKSMLILASFRDGRCPRTQVGFGRFSYERGS